MALSRRFTLNLANFRTEDNANKFIARISLESHRKWDALKCSGGGGEYTSILDEIKRLASAREINWQYYRVKMRVNASI